MSWKVARAKQNLSELLRAADREPQIIYRRDQLVAAVIGAETYAEFETWQRERARQRPLAEKLAELRRLCQEEDFELPTVPRSDRGNPFAEPSGDP